jgi:hypothetical protein
LYSANWSLRVRSLPATSLFLTGRAISFVFYIKYEIK